MKPLSLCFVAPHALGALESRHINRSEHDFGGAEVQMALVGSGLAARGHDVVFVCAGRGRARTEHRIGPLRVIVLASYRGILPNWLGLWRAYHREIRVLAPDVVYQRCAMPLTGLLARSCARLGARFAFAVANDRDVDGRSRAALGAAQDTVYGHGLRRADLVIVQSAQQADRLGGRGGRPVVSIPSAVEVPDRRHDRAGTVSTVLWVSSLLAKKRPLTFLDMVRRLPDVRFVAAAPPATDPAMTDRFTREAAGLDNLHWPGRVPYREMPALYDAASVLLNTSEAEGVPNTFLEAWARGVPVFSLRVDPDGAIARLGLGRVVGSEDLATALSDFLDDTAARRAAGEAGRRFVREHHALETVLDHYEEALQSLVS